MNKTKQFWALFKFQMMINPFLLIMPLLIFALPLWLTHHNESISDFYHPSLEIVLMFSTQNLFFVGFIGVLIMAPEFFQTGASSSIYASGTEFILTRAVDRPMLYRARTVLYYVLILAIPLASLAGTVKSRDLQLNEYEKAANQQILAQLPGSFTSPADKDGRTNIIIPNGNVMVESWRVEAFLLTVVGTQILILLTYRFKYRRVLLFAVYFGFIFLPLFTMGHSDLADGLSFHERLFLYYATHQMLSWSLTLAATAFALFWCERRFARLEQ